MTLLYIGSLLFGGSHLFAILFPGLRDSFRAQRAALQALSEEEAACEQWSASHFPSRRG